MSTSQTKRTFLKTSALAGMGLLPALQIRTDGKQDDHYKFVMGAGAPACRVFLQNSCNSLFFEISPPFEGGVALTFSVRAGVVDYESSLKYRKLIR